MIDILDLSIGALGAAMFCFLACRINNHIDNGSRGWPFSVVVGITAALLIAQATSLILQGSLIGVHQSRDQPPKGPTP